MNIKKLDQKQIHNNKTNNNKIKKKLAFDYSQTRKKQTNATPE